MTVLVDSNVLIDHLRDHGPATAFLVQLQRSGPIRSSIVSRAEVRAGVRGGAREIDRFISGVVWEPVTEAIADRAGTFARSYGRSHTGIGLVDYLIAATADVLGLDLKTRNTRHFPMFAGLESPY